MKTKLVVLRFLLFCTVSTLVWTTGKGTPSVAASDEGMAMKSPAEGYTVHVLAPHLLDGKQMGPYHHYCKVLAPDPVIQCLIYESIEPNARLSQVESSWPRNSLVIKSR